MTVTPPLSNTSKFTYPPIYYASFILAMIKIGQQVIFFPKKVLLSPSMLGYGGEGGFNSQKISLMIDRLKILMKSESTSLSMLYFML